VDYFFDGIEAQRYQELLAESGGGPSR